MTHLSRRTRRTRRTPVARLVALALVTLAGCADDQTLSSTTPPESARSVTPALLVAPDDSGATVTVALDLRGTIGGIGSFTGTLRFDQNALVFASEVSLNDGTLRASNPGAGTVRVAGASKSGIDPQQIASFRFKVLNRAGLSSLAFEVSELHEVSRADLRSIVRRGHDPRILK